MSALGSIFACESSEQRRDVPAREAPELLGDHEQLP